MPGELQPNPRTEPDVTLVIPCFNEEGNLNTLFERALSLVGKNPEVEVIFVDNGSLDRSGEILKNLSKDTPGISVVNVEINKGYGFGIKAGLKHSSGRLVGWTHADLQTDPMDVLEGLVAAKTHSGELIIKGRRQGRPFGDVFFTYCMSAFETLLFLVPLNDINAQPTLFSRSLLPEVLEGPNDFSLDLYTLVKAQKKGFIQVRFPVKFGPRFSGSSNWNTSMGARLKFILRTFRFSFSLAKELRSK
jgi:glycosyltransferase involved in cell wall biosynthesis